jgi:hypothetical protein
MGHQALRETAAPTDEPLNQRSGGVYPRLYWEPVNRNCSDSVMLFRVNGTGGLDCGLRMSARPVATAVIKWNQSGTPDDS